MAIYSQIDEKDFAEFATIKDVENWNFDMDSNGNGEASVMTNSIYAFADGLMSNGIAQPKEVNITNILKQMI